MMEAIMEKLKWGLAGVVPDEAEAAWGARLIWPDDLVWDRQDGVGPRVACDALQAWLNGGPNAGRWPPLAAALAKARELARTHTLGSSEQRQVTLYEDDRGIIVANPNGSYGYLYVAAWLKNPVPEASPLAQGVAEAMIALARNEEDSRLLDELTTPDYEEA